MVCIGCQICQSNWPAGFPPQWWGQVEFGSWGNDLRRRYTLHQVTPAARNVHERPQSAYCQSDIEVPMAARHPLPLGH